MKLPFRSAIHRMGLFPEAESFDDSPVSFDVVFLEVFEKLAAFTDQAQQRSLGAEVVLVLLEVFRKVADTVREQRDLALRRTGIGVRLSVLTEKLLLFF